MASEESREADTSVVVDEEELKRKTGEFELETIFFLDLSDRGLRRLGGAVPRCVGLRVLNLSSNQLDDVRELSYLVCLEELDLSANLISSLKDFDKLEKLQRLDLPGNNLLELESLLPLCGLPHLKTLSLRVRGTSLSNPLCTSTAHGGYELFMSHSFPNLSWLDGERVGGDRGGAGGVREERTELEKKLKRLEEMTKDGDRAESSETQGSNTMMSLNDQIAMERIHHLISECNNSSQRVQEHIQSLREDILH